MFDVTEVLKGLQAALDTAKNLAPVAQALGMPAEVAVIANVASAAADVANNIAQRIEDGRIVASNEDAAAVRSILADLQAENDNLARIVGAS